MTPALTRRHLLTAVGTAAVATALTTAPAGGASARPRLTLAPPTGPYRIGTVALHLRRGSRELMINVWYPARDTARYPLAPWLGPAPLRLLLDSAGLAADVDAPLTAGHRGAPVLPAAGRCPVVLFSHGAGGHRSEATIVVQELASHGYAVITVDHPRDSYGEFPGGRLYTPDDEDNGTPWDHADDIRFVLDRLDDLPAGLRSALDRGRIGMFGFSKGSTATALVMNTDRRVRAGLSLDGLMLSQPPPAPIDRPFMLMTAIKTPGADESGVGEFWPLLRGWRLQVHTEDSAHGSYTDTQWLIPQLAAIVGMSGAELEEWIGELAPAEAVRIQQAYPLAFFDRHLRNRRQRLLEAPSPAFPKVLFVD